MLLTPLADGQKCVVVAGLKGAIGDYVVVLRRDSRYKSENYVCDYGGAEMVFPREQLTPVVMQ